MLLFPNAKINIGLDVVGRRKDGYHELETIFYPIGLKDSLEFIENHTNKVNFDLSGIKIDSGPADNLIMKVYHLLGLLVNLPGLDIHLHKVIPIGAGLGGGSSDAAFFLMGLINYFELNIAEEKIKNILLQLGADCSFFLKNKPSFATGIGENFQDVDINLIGYHILVVKPPFGVSTKEAYSRIIPSVPQYHLMDSILLAPEKWLPVIKNDFEFPVFLMYPEIGSLKKDLLDSGAIYASMSGSGSSVFGIFKSDPGEIVNQYSRDYFSWKQKL